MRVMLLIYNNEATTADWSGPQGPRFQAAHRTLIHELTSRAELVQSSEIAPGDALAVTRRQGAVLVNAVEHTGADWLGGYYLVDVHDVARAIEITARLPEITSSYVEVRHVPTAPTPIRRRARTSVRSLC